MGLDSRSSNSPRHKTHQHHTVVELHLTHTYSRCRVWAFMRVCYSVSQHVCEILPIKKTFKAVAITIYTCIHLCIWYWCQSIKNYPGYFSVCIVHTYPVAGEASAVWQGQIGGCHVTNVHHSSNSWQDTGPRVTLTHIHTHRQPRWSAVQACCDYSSIRLTRKQVRLGSSM